MRDTRRPGDITEWDHIYGLKRGDDWIVRMEETLFLMGDDA